MGQIKTRCSTAAGLFLILLTVIAGFSSCKSNQKDIIPSAEYAPYVNAYTGGVISQNSTIRIELTQDQPMVDLNQELKDNPFSFCLLYTSPSPRDLSTSRMPSSA